MPSGPGPIADALIREIASAVPPPIATFLLTAETKAEAIVAHARSTGVSVVQVVSHIEPGESAALAALLPDRQRVQVIHVEGLEALERIRVYTPHVHAFLLDSGHPDARTPELGGTGRVHDWSVSRAFVEASPLPVFLAGGLHADNVGEAIRYVRPFALDVCSGVRTGGRLDEGKLRRWMEAVRQAEARA